MKKHRDAVVSKPMTIEIRPVQHAARFLGFLVALVVIDVAPGYATAAGTLTVAQQPVTDEKAVFATVESISVVPARGRIGGTVVQLAVREGDRVTAGQAIATIGDESSSCR